MEPNVPEPYESEYVGQFIFALGYVSRANGMSLSTQSVSLLVQNPGDQVLGDLVAGWAGRKFIFEFKRSESEVRTELRKPHKLMWLQELKRATAQVREITAQGHFVAFGGVKDDLGASIGFMPFCDIVDGPVQPATRRLDLNQFFTQMIGGKIGFSSHHYIACVNALKKCHAECAAAGASSGAGMTSLVMNYEAGRITLAVTDLVTGRELVRERDIGRERSITDERRERTRSKGRGGIGD